MTRRIAVAFVLILGVLLGGTETASAMYNPQLGRFLQRDVKETALPIVTAMAFNGQVPSITTTRFEARDLYDDGMNLYQYVRSNPVCAVDPSGLDRWYVDTGYLGHHYVIVEAHGHKVAIGHTAMGGEAVAPYILIDFRGINGTGYLWDTGVIKVDPYRGKIGVDPAYPRAVWTKMTTSRQEDFAMIDKALEEAKHPPDYNIILYNCQSYSRHIWPAGTQGLRALLQLVEENAWLAM